MTAPNISVVIHGHFYQPPREDPWLETIEPQPSALPYHDWNERVAAECYSAVVAARVPGPGGRILDIRNTLEQISFNFGPTLLGWMEHHDADTYQAILEADATSVGTHGGFGNAIAQAYHHTILPLASRREKEREVRWGIRDFQNRFGRDPAGMWLPETAVDGETLDVLAQEGIAFTILAPHQVVTVPPQGRPGLFRTSGGREIALFIYDGPLSHGVAFGRFLENADKWSREMAVGSPGPRLVSLATDGESYGHHHRFGEMALARVLQLLEEDPRIRIDNYSSFLARNPAVHEVELVEPSSWSCAHGVERWRSNCGCKMDPTANTQQEWRESLRESLTWLASEIHRIFEAEGPPLLGDVWGTLDRWIFSEDMEVQQGRARELLELERQAARFFTSCGWFFDDLAGLEARQVLSYAARALELVGPGRAELEAGFLTRLQEARSNEEPPRDGKTIFLDEVKPHLPAPMRIAAGAGLWHALDPEGGTEAADPSIPGYGVVVRHSRRVSVSHRRTQRTWDFEVHPRQPSDRSGAAGVRRWGTEDPPLPVAFRELPEAYRVMVEWVLTRETPDPAAALQLAIQALEEAVAHDPDPVPTGEERSQTKDARNHLEDQVNRILELAFLLEFLGLPIPRDAQTLFHRISQKADPVTARRLMVLREPLGFTLLPPETS